MTDTNKPATLICSCCGRYTKGRQWWNQDAGYGLCGGCVELTSRGQTDDWMRRAHGVRGVNYDLRQLFMVVSYHSDEQRTDYDFVAADDADEAHSRIAEAALRSEHVICDTFTLAALKELVRQMEETTFEHAEKDVRELEGGAE